VNATRDRAHRRFAEVVVPHLDDAYRLARWIVGNRPDAEDVVQDACLRAFRAIGDYSTGNARAWLLAIVRNAAFTRLAGERRRRGIDEAAGSSDPAAIAAADSTTPEAALISKTEAARLEAAIAGLPDPYRETLVLRDISDLAYRDIAAITGVPIGTVMSRLARARALLLAAIGKETS
jgi:RNA polymerase sigma factor (sigma-70 family)